VLSPWWWVDDNLKIKINNGTAGVIGAGAVLLLSAQLLWCELCVMKVLQQNKK